MDIGRSPIDAIPGDTRRGATQGRIVAAAMALFEEGGYDATTIDAVADRAGVSRRTFFHHFASKDAVLFLDHASLIDRAARSLQEQGQTDPVMAVGDALRTVLASYLAEPEIATARYRLIRASPELRAREISWVHRYQLLFSRYLDDKYSGQPRGHLTADVLAASLVAMHNNVLRTWLKNSGRGDAQREFAEALEWFTRSVGLARRGDEHRRLVVAVFDDDVDSQAIAAAVERARKPSGDSAMFKAQS